MASVGTRTLRWHMLSMLIKLHPAVSEQKKIAANLVHRDSGADITYDKKADGDDVSPEDVAKAFATSSGEEVVVEKDEIDALLAGPRERMDIIAMVPVEEIPTLLYQKPYFIEPERGNDEVYVLLRDALNTQDAAAMVKFMLRRGRQQFLGAITVHGSALVLHQLYYPELLRTADKLKIPTTAASDDELKLAQQLIKQSTKPFKSEDYQDTLQDELQALIDAKTSGRIPEAPPAPRYDQARSILTQLQESVAQARGRNGSKKTKPTLRRSPSKQPRSVTEKSRSRRAAK